MNKGLRPNDRRNLYLRNGIWVVDITIRGERIHQAVGPDFKAARLYRDKLRSWKRDINAGIPTQRPTGEILKFEVFADKYLDGYAKRKRSYDRDQRSVAHLKSFFSGRLLTAINAAGVVDYRTARAKADIGVGTINRELACLRTMMNKAVEWGNLREYPLPRKHLLEREPEFKPRIFEPEEIGRVLAHAEPRWLRPAVVVYVRTGMRKRELLKLKRTDVDFKRRTLTIRAENSKTGKSRTIPIDDVSAETLAAMPGQEYFFETAPGVHKLDVWASFKAACVAAGINGRVRIHDLRDTAATQMLRNGVDIRTVAAIIGDSPETTLKRYCHTDENQMRRAADRMSAFWAVTGENPHEFHTTAADASETRPN